MIYLLNLNPSLDYHMLIADTIYGETNRSNFEYCTPGGKGTNASIVLSNLGVPNTLLGFVGGFTGDYIDESLEKFPLIQNSMIKTNISTRINVKLHGLKDTEINAVGSTQSSEDWEKLNQYINCIESGSIVVISGKLPLGISESWYREICQSFYSRDISFVLDIASPIVVDLCQYHPILIKPNKDELEVIFRQTITSDEQRDSFAKELIRLGARNCLLSLGSEGSIFYSSNDVYEANVIHGKIINVVGAGDSMVAGFLSGFTEGKSIAESFELACASAAASIFSTKLATKDKVDELMDIIKIRKL